MPESDILDITSQYETDSKITKNKYHSYTPYTTSFNNNDEIRISIQQTDVYPYLHENFIFLEGMFSETDKVKLSNNGYSYLFEQIRLEIMKKKEVCLFLSDLSKLLNILNSEPPKKLYGIWNLKTASKLEKPRFIIIGLQKGRKNVLTKDCSIFDHFIDTSKRNDSATASAVDVQLEIEASESLAGVTAYCLLIDERIVEYVPFTREENLCKYN
ncbi:hypothetical protein QTP88_017939 [Uroleucon formosanum]